MVETESGAFRMRWYADRVHGSLHVALLRGSPGTEPPLVRVHLRDTQRDLIGIRGEHAGWTLRAALERIAREPHGVVVVLRPQESLSEIVGPGSTGSRRRHRRGPRRATHLRHRRPDPARSRRHAMRVLSAPRQLLGIAAFGLEITGYEE